ncbi:MAG: DNA-binding protein [Chloroflexota bacterium]|nr:DNA-binding protein [Chloroflexota bacterium]
MEKGGSPGRFQQHGSQKSDLPGELAQPARRALLAAGCQRLEQVAELSEAEVKHLHGIGPNALDQLRRALAAHGLAFADGTEK